MRAIVACLAVLLLSGCGGPRRPSGYGISLAAPRGWHVRVSRGKVEATTGGLDVVLFEDTPDAQWSPPLEFAVYRSGMPRPFGAGDFAGPPFGGDNPGHHSFARRNFTVAGRYFDLFVESGSAHPSTRRLSELDRLVRSLRIRPGDFYPGSAEPARFRPAAGWRTATVGTLPNGTSMFSVTVASTGRYVDALNSGAPTQTLAWLRRDGIVIQVRLDADNRAPPPRRGTAFRFHALQACTFGDGPPLPHASCSGASRVVAGEYTASVDIVYARSRPTARQRARARAEVSRLVLPRWVRWN